MEFPPRGEMTIEIRFRHGNYQLALKTILEQLWRFS